LHHLDVPDAQEPLAHLDHLALEDKEAAQATVVQEEVAEAQVLMCAYLAHKNIKFRIQLKLVMTYNYLRCTWNARKPRVWRARRPRRTWWISRISR
jgi:hypothetical protein